MREKAWMAASRASVTALVALALVAGCDASSWGVPVPMVDTGTRFDAGVGDGGALDGSMDASDGSRDAARDVGMPTDTSPDVGNDASGRGLLCAACTTNDDCSANSFCVQLATTGQLACLVRCDAEIPSCPRRFDCLNSVITPTPGPVCTPVGAPCCIDNDDDGYGAGIGCRGTDCNDDNASVSPMATEICDGVDNDCDGMIDQGDPGSGQVCSTGMPGVCGPGVSHCVSGAIACQPSTPASDETCNGLDDDCDANLDEGPSGGALTQSCYGGPTGTEGVGTCAPGLATCSGGTFGTCTGEVRPGTETCNGMDDDCDGTPDDGNPGGGVVCSTGQPGACSAGTTRCNLGAIECAPNLMSMGETCNGQDDNCNGMVDEASTGGGALTQPCYGGPTGTDGVGLCMAGSQTCSGGSFGSCTGEVRPATELCNGDDDDCDGTPDDGNPGGGFACSTGAAGVCSAGTAQCQSGAIACVPTITAGSMTEICDGLDNDCDGTVDDGFTGLGGPCSAGVGACAAAGVLVCNAANRAGPPICNATPGAPSTEICDGIDNNCNGTTDEGFAGLSGPCSAGVGACTASGIVICNPANRAGPPICNATPGAPSTEICDGVDNNCNGTTDEGFAGLSGPCSAGVGACTASGVVICNPANRAGPPICSATPGSPTAEICDAIDNNCNGTVDEGFAGLAGPCSSGVGACTAPGVLVCNPANRAGPPICNATPGSPTAEICDAIDNNCNGTIDEGFAGLAGPCSSGVGACVASGVVVCNPADRAGPPICNAVEGSPTTERCDGIDNNCNGTVDDGFAGLGTACTTGLGVCLRGGVTVCAPSQLTTMCTAPMVTGTGEICNYLDDDCDGTVDDGFVNGSGLYTGNTNCGACGVDCTMIFAHPNAFGTCNVSGSSASCVMNCNANSFDLNAVPNDGCEFTLDASAIYVSTNDPMSADDATCGLGPVGTGAGRHPCRTIAFGQSRATATSRTRVLVADGLYSVDVTIVNGQSLLGGYRADTWERHVATTLTTIRGTTGAGHRRAITATNITMSTLVEGFSIEGASASSAGANSYAIYVSGGTSALSFQNNVVYAGNGAPGGPGSAGTDGLAGTNGAVGLDAVDAGVRLCTMSRVGPAGGARTCGGVSVGGGAGGSALCQAAPLSSPLNDGTAHSSQVGGTGATIGGVLDGSGGMGGARAFDGNYSTAACNLCTLPMGGGQMTGTNGAFGANGLNGAAGLGASVAVGSVVASEWVGVVAGNGGAAGSGGGGGGGSAGGGGQGSATCHDNLGGTGGSGGSGGCGGASGTGGLAGGGSFGIFVVNTVSYPVLVNNIVYRGFGGTGGNGGRGGGGGVGGNGMAGGRACTAFACFCTGTGGTGGGGGNGGHGGGGGGGAGGVAYGIYVSGASGYGLIGNTFPVSGGGGAGGTGGPSLGNPGTTGVTGASAATD